MAWPSPPDTRGPSGGPLTGVRTAGKLAPGPKGELKSLAELEDVKDGEESEESDEVTEKNTQKKHKRF